MGAFISIFVRRPVLASVVGFVILVLGLASIWGLNVREYPESSSTTITVSTPYLGANADLVRGFITAPLERAIASAEGIEYIESTSTQGSSNIQAHLTLNFPPNDAVAQILTRINEVRNELPPEAENPIVTVRQSGSDASLYLGFTSDWLNLNQITDYLNRVVRPRLESVEGVQQANVFGETLAMRIWLDPERMAALDVTAAEVEDALAANNFRAAVGETRGELQSITLIATTGLQSVDEFQNLAVRQEETAVIRLRDIATVELGAESYSSDVIFNGKPAVFMAIETVPTANVLSVIDEVRALWPDIQSQLPAALQGEIVQDATIFIRSSIGEVFSAMLQTLAIVAVVLYLFLGSVRAALVPTVAMVLSIVGSFFIMLVLGFSINLLTLLALILAVGSVVDDGIVISENVSRYTEQGVSSFDAAIRTGRELGTSIVAMNIVVLAVFTPVAFLGGLTGTLFIEFAFTTAGATLISGLVALTLAPMMASRLIKHNEEKSGLARWVDAGFARLAGLYLAALRRTLDVRWLVLGLGACAVASCWLFYSAAQSELAPEEDQGAIFVSATGSPNVSLDRMTQWTHQLQGLLGSLDVAEDAFVITGGGGGGEAESINDAFGILRLKDWEERDRSAMEIMPQVQGLAASVAGLQTVAFTPSTLPGTGGGPPVQYVISSTEEPLAISENAEAVLDSAEASGLFSYIESDLKFDQLQVEIVIDREKASDLGIDMRQLGTDLSVLLSEDYVNFFSIQNRSYRVIPQVDRAFRLTPETLEQFQIRTADGDLIPMSTVIELRETVQPRQLLSFNQLNSAILSGTPAPGVSTGEAIAFLQQAGEELLPQDYVVDWAGSSRQFVEESYGLIIAFGLAVILIFLVLAAQYESYRDPLIMLITIPMSVAGALAFAALGVITINIYTQVGLLALAGSVVRHGILLVEFANDVQEREGLDRRAAVERAAAVRLRSIVMTTLATLFGMIPLLIAAGPGAESRFAISFVLGIGLAIGTFFTLFVVPALYTVIARRRTGRALRQGGAEPLPQAAEALMRPSATRSMR